MVRPTIARLRLLALTQYYVVTKHAEEELNDEGLDEFDIVEAVSSGVITHYQRDPVTREVKAVVRGFACDGGSVEIVARLGHTGKMVIITVYRC